MLRCAERIVKEHGGSATRRTSGAFQVLQNAAGGSAHLAVAELGPLVLAEPPYLDHALAAAAGKEPRLSAEPRHAELLKSVGGGLVVATVVLSILAPGLSANPLAAALGARRSSGSGHAG